MASGSTPDQLITQHSYAQDIEHKLIVMTEYKSKLKLPDRGQGSQVVVLEGFCLKHFELFLAPTQYTYIHPHKYLK